MKKYLYKHVKDILNGKEAVVFISLIITDITNLSNSRESTCF